ncbi:MAG TPA: hypothetical protein VGN83_06530 [Falsiroseomonas sp.]|jgi:hypothetical protein|nr:hypothetical protein [Falsiroseomonas sp.]
MHAIHDIPPALHGVPEALLIGDGFPHEPLPHEPFPHGPFLVEPDGALRATGVPALRFAWRGRSCEARIADGHLRLAVSAGAVPYTAERPLDRPGALAAVGQLPLELPAGWRLRVLPDHRLRLETDVPLPLPTTAIALVGAMVGFALALNPYLDRLESAGVSGGSANT